ncbi:MAG TPA: choice-of-anchor V domain-containing protein, partial [Steroidobacteraceae bacterium]
RVAPPAAFAALLLTAPALLALHFRDGPPARVTGGFGEDSCAACHFGNELNESRGQLMLGGFPGIYQPGARYELELALARPRMAAAGFQLAIRSDPGSTQAGMLRVPETDESHMDLRFERGVQFAQHRLAESAPGADGMVRWKLTWTAPEAGGRAVLHAAAVAGDGDESQAGDYVYTLEAISTPN